MRINKPKISIIVPVYNSFDTLTKCVESILTQTYSDFELILVNDGSVDGSGDLCKHYEELDVRVHFIDKKNGGPGSARNMGLDYATGEWVTFCDSDDYVDSLWLETFILHIDGVQLVVQGFNFVGRKLPDAAICQFEGVARDGVEVLYKYPIPGSLCNKCLNRNLIEMYNLRFNEDFRFREDEDLLLKYVKHIDRMKVVPYSGYNYVVPEFDVKYESVDAFPAFMSIYKSLNDILGDKSNFVTDTYIKDLAFSVFYSYDHRQNDRKRRLVEFREVIGSLVCNVNKIPWHMRFILGVLPLGLAHYIIEVKRELLKRF